MPLFAAEGQINPPTWPIFPNTYRQYLKAHFIQPFPSTLHVDIQVQSVTILVQLKGQDEVFWAKALKTKIFQETRLQNFCPQCLPNRLLLQPNANIFWLINILNSASFLILMLFQWLMVLFFTNPIQCCSKGWSLALNYVSGERFSSQIPYEKNASLMLMSWELSS